MPDIPKTLLSHPHIWQASQLHGQATATPPILPTGMTALDHALHLGGWPADATSELLLDHYGIGEFQLVLQPLLHNTRDRRRIFLVSPPHIPFAPALAAMGGDLSRLLIAQPPGLKVQLWTLEQILRSGTSMAVVSWFGQRQPSYADLRRLQIVARSQASALMLFRPRGLQRERSPAALRLTMECCGDRLKIEIIKQRGGWSGQTVMVERPHPAGWRAAPAMLLPALSSGQSASYTIESIVPAHHGIISRLHRESAH